MKYNVELLSADILDELAKVRRMIEEFASLSDKLDFPAKEITPYDKAAIGYYLHSFYNGCENIFRNIALFFENELQANSWHRNILKRMKLEIRGFRPRVISDELYLILEDFRGFRHKFRHSYSYELDWEKERIVALKLEKAHKMLQNEILQFLEHLKAIDKEADE